MTSPPAWAWWYFPVRAFAEKVVRGVVAHGDPRVRATSWWRSPADNVRVGGSGPPPLGVGGPVSQHLVGLAVDLVAQDNSALAVRLGDEGLVAVDELSHVHAQLWPRGQLDSLLGL